MKTSGGKELKTGWKMTIGQHNSYWRLFGDVTNKMGWYELSKDELRERRLDLHEQAGLGRKSANQIHYLKEVDAIFGVFRAILDPANLDAQLRALKMERTRLLWKIQVEQLALLTVFMAGADDLERGLAAERYITKVMSDGFHTGDMADLSAERIDDRDSDLERLRSTIARVISELRQKRGMSVHELHQAANLPCPRECRDCAFSKAAVKGQLATA